MSEHESRLLEMGGETLHKAERDAICWALDEIRMAAKMRDLFERQRDIAEQRAVAAESELAAQRQRAESVESLVAGIESHVVKQWPNDGLGYDRKNLPAIVMWIIEERDRVYLKGTSDHDHGEKCPTYYDGCHCTVDALEHNIKRAESAERERDTLAAWKGSAMDLLSRYDAIAETFTGKLGSSKIANLARGISELRTERDQLTADLAAAREECERLREHVGLHAELDGSKRKEPSR